jgi:hypothetical protein
MTRRIFFIALYTFAVLVASVQLVARDYLAFGVAFAAVAWLAIEFLRGRA